MDQAASAVDFLQRCARGEVAASFARHIAEGVVHHNPHFAHDREALLRAMEAAAAAEPGNALEVRQVLADGDRVAVFSRLRRAASGPDMAVAHLLRFEGGRIVELWDLAQPVPADAANALGMF